MGDTDFMQKSPTSDWILNLQILTPEAVGMPLILLYTNLQGFMPSMCVGETLYFPSF